MDDNFDPGERYAATQGLRGAYDGEGFGVAGGNNTDTSWLRDGYGYVPDQDENFSFDQVYKMLSDPTPITKGEIGWIGTGVDFEKNLPGQLLSGAAGWGGARGSGGYQYKQDGQFVDGDLSKDLRSFIGDGITRHRGINLEDPLKWHDVFKNSEGKIIGERDGRKGNSFWDKYGEAIAKGLGGAIVGAGVGSLFAGGASVGGGGLSASASGGGTGAGFSTGAATGGTGSGLGAGASGGFGASGGGLGSLGGFGTGIAKSGLQAAFNTAMNGGKFGENFLQNYLTSGVNVGNLGNFGEYTDIINKGIRGAASGYISGGPQGALLGAASPGINQGMNKLGDYFSNAFSGTDWDEDSFGSGNYSMGAPQGGLQGVFAQNGISTGAPQGPMSTNSQMQLGAGSGNQIDWDAVLQGQQGFGNTNPQEQGPEAQSMSGYQPSAFGVGMDTAMPNPMQMANAPTTAPAQGYDEYVKQMPDALKAVLIARYPQLRGVLGGGARMSPLAAGAGALATIYTANRASKDLKKQSGQLDSLYGQNSAYSKAMREQLARKDAAAGRRSQYGPREVELQARLAQLNGQLAPQRFALSQAQDQNRLGMYGSLLNYADQSGLSDYAGKQLSDFFKKIGT